MPKAKRYEEPIYPERTPEQKLNYVISEALSRIAKVKFDIDYCDYRIKRAFREEQEEFFLLRRAWHVAEVKLMREVVRLYAEKLKEISGQEPEEKEGDHERSWIASASSFSFLLDVRV